LKWQRGISPDFESLDKIKPLESDPRTHVAIDRTTGTVEDGQLFQTEGLSFHKRVGGHDLEKNRGEFALLARFAGDLSATTFTLGGERRLSWLDQAPNDPLGLPDDHHNALKSSQHIVVHLATPAIFKNGWKPGWLNNQLEGTPPDCDGLVLRLKAVVMERWQGISGWNLAKNEPRATRKAVPAGSVYWFEIVAKPEGWANKLWLAALSDDVQDRLNGFGLAVPGPWKKQAETI
jgi:CRISPR-associated protein Cmr3